MNAINIYLTFNPQNNKAIDNHCCNARYLVINYYVIKNSN